MSMGYRYEFDEPTKDGRRAVRALLHGHCIMSGTLVPQSVSIVEPYVAGWVPRDNRDGKPTIPWTEMSDGDAMDAIAQLIAAVSKSIVCVFVDNFPWSLDAVRTFATEPEADAYMLGVRDVTDEVIAAQWPFTAESLVLRGVHRLNAPTLIGDARTRIDEMGLVTT